MVNFKDIFKTQRGLGAFLGVFTPTVLTILGVILYLRLGWVVGQRGLPQAVLIVAIANGITLITAWSFSAISTNLRVGVGGAYYIVSRSLGLELGGAVGLPLFLSQSFSVTLYSFGLAESLRFIWPGLSVPWVAFFIVLGVSALAYRGIGLALKIQIPLMILIGLSLAALAIGAWGSPPVTAAISSNTEPVENFWVVFAVFFPAVTGIMVGLGLSGDLRDPIRAIPRGALGACLIGFAIYLMVPFLLHKGASPEALRENPLIWTKIALFGGAFVLPALWGAIFSSAVGSILGAPRTLQALAKDGLAPKTFANTFPDRPEPRMGLLVTTAIAGGAVLLGNLNAVAPVVTMFFLTVYTIINLVAALETLSGTPSWRPTLSVPWPIAMLGALGCITAMFLISVEASIAAILVEIGLWVFLAKRGRKSQWGDMRRDLYESLIRWSLIHLAEREETPKNWRPHILVFVEKTENYLDLIRFGNWFSQGRGVVTVCELVVGNLLTQQTSILEREKKIRQILKHEGITAFGEVDVVHSLIPGITSVTQANGLAGLDSNTIMLGWPENTNRMIDFLKVIRHLERLNKSVILGKIQPGLIPQEMDKLDVLFWWGGLQHNSDLILLLSHLLSKNPEWRRARIKILSIASNQLMKENSECYLENLINEIRIEAQVEVFLHSNNKSINEIILEKSGEADLVFLGIGLPEDDSEKELAKYADHIMALGNNLETVFFVKNSSLFVGHLVQNTEE